MKCIELPWQSDIFHIPNEGAFMFIIGGGIGGPPVLIIPSGGAAGGPPPPNIPGIGGATGGPPPPVIIGGADGTRPGKMVYDDFSFTKVSRQRNRSKQKQREANKAHDLVRPGIRGGAGGIFPVDSSIENHTLLASTFLS